MNSTATKGIWTQDLPKGYSMEVNTNSNKIRVFAPKRHLLTLDIGHDIYPEDVEKAREKVIEDFNLNKK